MGILTAIVLSGSEYVPFPDENQLPLFVLATLWLAWLFPPTAIVTMLILFRNREFFGDITLRKNQWVFLPMFISGGCFVFWLIV